MENELINLHSKKTLDILQHVTVQLLSDGDDFDHDDEHESLLI